MERVAMGAELRALRLLRGFSVVEAARRAGMSRVSLHRWEAGEQEPRGRTLAALLDALEADPKERAGLLAESPAGIVQPAAQAGPLGPPAHPGGMLRALREARRLTQSGLARAVGLSQSAIAQWESGKVMPTDAATGRVLALLGGEELELREGSLDLYDPIVDPLDARLRIRDARCHADDPLAPVRLLALERELWPLAARDARWEEALAEVLAWRATCHLARGEHTASIEPAKRALRIAEAGGHWEVAYQAFGCLGSVYRSRATNGRESARQEPRFLDYAKRIGNPLVRADVLRQALARRREASVAGGRADATLDRRLLPQIRGLVGDAEPDELFYQAGPFRQMDLADVDLFAIVQGLAAGDVDAAVRLYADRFSNDWDRRLTSMYNGDFEKVYVQLYLAAGEPIPEQGLGLLNQASRMVMNWSDGQTFRWIADRFGTDAHPVEEFR